MAIKGWLNLNGTFIEEKTPVIRADNRAFRYGDGLFETMKVVVGAIRLRDLHFERLFKGMETLQIMLQGFINADMFEEQIMKKIPEKDWGVGMAISFLGREVCHKTNPEHEKCIMKDVCSLYRKVKLQSAIKK